MRTHFSIRRVAAAVLAVSTLLPAAAQACTSCGCTLGTDWVSEGYAPSAGLRLDLRYDDINQNELRHGRHGASAQDVAAALSSGSAEETQQYTQTRFYTLGLDYSFSHDWGVDLQLPYLSRSHATLGDGDSEASRSSTRGLGDMRILGRYQGLVEDRSLGLQFGLKLPTGSFQQNFSAGPAAGERLDRGLQPGTGTVDLLLGAYHFQAFSREWDHFEQLQIKLPLNSRDDFRPAVQIAANAGVRYVGFEQLVPQLQLNYKWEGKESGAQADRPNSGSSELYLSPGLSLTVVSGLTLYGFAQLPLVRRYDGLQLAPKYTVTGGVRYSF